MTKKPKRTPVRAPKRQSSRKSKPRKTTIRKNLLNEYDERISKDGVVEALTLANSECLANVPLYISTQSLELDRLLNGRGIPCGRVTEIYGPWHIGKSTILDHCFAEVQHMGGIAILADTEGARDVRYSQSIGVDPNALRYLEFAENELHVENVLLKIYETVQFWKETDFPVLIGWDALAGTATREEVEKRLDKNRQPAQAAKVLREACRQLPGKLGNTKIAVVICNHEYEKIQMRGFVGRKRETYGGAAIRHLASIRLELHSVGEWVKRSDGQILGRVVGARLVKNRLGNPWGEARFALLSGIGIDNTWSIFQKFKQAGFITVSGSWAAMNLDGEVLKFQGWSGLVEKCREDETLFPRLVSIYSGMQ